MQHLTSESTETFYCSLTKRAVMFKVWSFYWTPINYNDPSPDAPHYHYDEASIN